MEARVAAGILLLVALSLSAVVFTATRVATRSAVARAADNLEDARSAFYRLVDDRAEFAAQQTRLIIELPLFRSMMINPIVAKDVATLTEIADSYRQNLNAQFAIRDVDRTDAHGDAGMAAGTDDASLPGGGHQGAAAGESRRDIVSIDGKLFLVTSEPAKFAEAEVLGTVTFGFPLDDRVAQELAQITRADVNLVSGNRLAGSSLSAAEQKDVVSLLAAGSLTSATGISPERRRSGSESSSKAPSHSSAIAPTDVGHLVLLQDWAPTQAFLDELRTSLLFAGIGAFVLALAGGLFFSHRTSQPLMDMAAAARDIAGGDWTRTVPARGSAEATKMATAFNDMTRSLRDQADRLNAAYQRFSTVTQSARDAIVSTDTQRQTSPSGIAAREATFGYSESRSAGEADHDADGRIGSCRVHGGAADPNADDLTFGRIIEVTGVRKDGGMFPSEFSLAALHGARGHGIHGGHPRRRRAQAVAGDAAAA